MDHKFSHGDLFFNEEVDDYCLIVDLCTDQKESWNMKLAISPEQSIEQAQKLTGWDGDNDYSPLYRVIAKCSMVFKPRSVGTTSTSSAFYASAHRIAAANKICYASQEKLETRYIRL